MSTPNEKSNDLRVRATARSDRYAPDNTEDNNVEIIMGGFLQQLRALLWRNYLLKKRNKGQVLQELFFPVYFVFLLAIIKATLKPDTQPSRTFPPHDINSTDFGVPFSAEEFIYVAPNSSKHDQWMKDIVSELNGPPQYRMFESEASAEAAYRKNHKKVKFGIIFDYLGDEDAYAIRTNFDDIPNSKEIYDFQPGVCRKEGNGTSSDGCRVNQYMTSGFVQLQIAIDNCLLKRNGVKASTLSSRKMQVQMMDLGEYSPDTSRIQTVSSIYFVFSFCILASYLAINIVSEKEKKIKDGMLMMGLNPNVFWLSWSIIYMGMVAVSSAIMILIIQTTSFFTQSNLFLLFSIFLLYGASFIALGFMITPFFNKARVAGAVAGFSTVFVSLLYLIITETREKNSIDSSLPIWSQWLLCLLSPLAFSSCMDKAIYYDLHFEGVGFDESLTKGEFPLYVPIVMLVVDTVLYSLLTFYFDKVVPGEYGITYKPYFFLQRSYWFPASIASDAEQLVKITRTVSQIVDVESVPADMESKLAMKLMSISKSFKSDDKVTHAVNDFSLDIYEGQITGLLGHNGAGKTTLMNMLTGVTPPTSGTASILGLDIMLPEEMRKIRRNCGICPQHNILYDELSCKEHLMIFADIKGVPKQHQMNKVEQALKDVDLEHQGDTFAKDLSGGQKRKLSVAIALIGNPKLIFLDEPTAGMDPYSRRHLWSLLKKKKEGRIVLLTTHFMDEADILADRKAFIRKGKLRCCGSSLFLKNKFGIGYHLTMVVDPKCEVEKVTSVLVSITPRIQHQHSHGKEVSYIIPLEDVSKFSELFSKLDASSSDLGIKSYGVSMTTLEEVFLKLESSEQDETEDGSYDALNNTLNFTGNALGVEEAKAEAALFTTDLIKDEKKFHRQQFKTLLWIRFLSVIRNKAAVFFQLCIPLILVVAGLLIVKLRSSGIDPIPEALPLVVNYYVNSSLTPTSIPLPGILVFDSIESLYSIMMIRGMKEYLQVDDYSSAVVLNTSFVKPHFVGIELKEMYKLVLTNTVALYNVTALHAIPAAVSFVTQAILVASGSKTRVNATTFPWPEMSQKVEYDSNTMTAGILIGSAFLLIVPGFTAEIVRDRETKVRSQLRISGVNFHIYWGTIYIINFAVYLIPCFLIIILTLAIQIPGLDSLGAMGSTIVLFLLNIPFLCFFAMVLSFMFNKADTCNSYLPFLLYVVALVPYICVSLLDMLDKTDTAIILHYICCVVDPAYIVFGGFYFIVRLSHRSSINGLDVEDSAFFDANNHTVMAMVMPLVHMIWMYWLLRVLDVIKTGGKIKEAFPCLSKKTNVFTTPNKDNIDKEDDDVLAERTRIDSLKKTAASEEKLRPAIRMEEINSKSVEPVAYTLELRKTFVKRVQKKNCWTRAKNKTKVAVRNLSLGVNEGEVLGLLGPNGAGKTTALNMIIAETDPTCGQVIVDGQDIRTSMLNLTSLGYCPQHDALWDRISLREHILCFAALKGVHHSEAENLVDFYISNMKLGDHKYKRAKKMSGGTRRKLSYILSILGNPNVVLLDEPSTGMDPMSKRFLWDTISATFRNTDKGAILTTHYMEEADALCDRVGIMVNGQLQCLGSTQHLKDKFGSGYILETKLAITPTSPIEELMDKLEEHLRQLFPNLEYIERFMERAQYAIPKENVNSLGATFASLEDCKQSHHLEEYNFSQGSLEQIFLYFAKKQVEEVEEETSHTVEPGDENTLIVRF